MKIIVIGSTDYKEKDFIINAISEEGPVSFKVRGGLNPNSPFAWLKTPLMEAEVEYVENVRYIHQILKGATLVASPLTNSPTFESMSAISLALEIINKMFQDDEKHLMFREIEKYITAIKTQKEYTLAELVFTAKAIKANGSSLEVNKCIYCGSKKKIVAFNFAEGGFICSDCIGKDTTSDLNLSQMKIIRYLFNANEYKEVDRDTLPFEDLKAIFNKFYEFIYDNIGVKVDSLTNIIKSL